MFFQHAHRRSVFISFFLATLFLFQTSLHPTTAYAVEKDPGSGLELLRLQWSDVVGDSSADSDQKETWGGLFTTAYNWGAQIGHVGKGLYHVMNTVWLQPLPSGLYDNEHPWSTGLIPGTDQKIWPRNILYASPRRGDLTTIRGEPAHPDDRIVSVIGNFLRARALRSARTPQYPKGKPKWEAVEVDGKVEIHHTHPFPFAVDYIHGAVHYNGVFLLFNDVRDGITHVSNPHFMKELVRFASEEKREVTIVFRDPFHGITTELAEGQLKTELKDWKNLSTEEQTEAILERRLNLALKLNAYFTTHLRSEHYWFGNPQGPFRRKALWGDWAPYPVMNAINGSWVHDVDENLRIPDATIREQVIIRAPLEKNKYFSSEYFRGSSDPSAPRSLSAQFIKDSRHNGVVFNDKLLAWLTAKRIEKTKKATSSNFNFVDTENLLGIVPKDILDRAAILQDRKFTHLKEQEKNLELAFETLKTASPSELKFFFKVLDDFSHNQSQWVMDSAYVELKKLFANYEEIGDLCQEVAPAYEQYSTNQMSILTPFLKTSEGELSQTQLYRKFFEKARQCLESLAEAEGLSKKSLYLPQGTLSWLRSQYDRLVSLPSYLRMIPEAAAVACNYCIPGEVQEGSCPVTDGFTSLTRQVCEAERIRTEVKGRDILESHDAYSKSVSKSTLNILAFNHTLHSRDKIAIAALELPHSMIMARLDGVFQRFSFWPLTHWLTSWVSSQSNSVPGLIPVGEGHDPVEKVVQDFRQSVSHNLVIFPQGTTGNFNQQLPLRDGFSKKLLTRLLEEGIQIRIFPMTVVHGPSFLQTTHDPEAFESKKVEEWVDSPIQVQNAEDIENISSQIRFSWMKHLPHDSTTFLHGQLRTSEALFLREQYLPLLEFNRKTSHSDQLTR